MIPFNYKSVLVTGGTGSFGKHFIRTILTRYPHLERVIVFSRDELKQYEMQEEFPESKYPVMRYFLGDVRDRDRLIRAFEDVEVVIHAAALKQVPAAEYNPFEVVKTNVIGGQNVIEAAIAQGVRRVVALSTDKAAAPINLYGATKLCADKLFVAANNFTGNRDLRLCVVRYGNVLGSRGSVVPFFLRKRSSGSLPITDERMTRFSITLEEGVEFVLRSLNLMWGGEIFVPRLPSYRIVDVAEAIGPACRQEIVGLRPGEKIHEEMITETDGMNTLEFRDHFVILPTFQTWNVEEYGKALGGVKCEREFRYHSGDNKDWLTVDQIRSLVKEHLDPSFSA